jgi:mono/diheme cytochrome c family protein
MMILQNIFNRSKKWRHFKYLLIGIVLLVLSGCTGSLLTDVTPPPDYQPTRQVLSSNPSAVDISPLLPPDPEAGKKVYSENCAACHGITGMGDGERVGSLPADPSPLGLGNYSGKSIPVIWFQTITQGKIDKLMPGYGSSLSDRQRWDVVAFLFSIGSTPEQLADGEQVFLDHCQSCHGDEAAAGSSKAPVFTDAILLQRSLEEIVQAIAQGKGSMPAMADTLTEDQMLDTAKYLRFLVFAAPLAEPVEENQQTSDIPLPVLPQTEKPARELSISGKVINGSGEAIPAGLDVEIIGFDSMESAYSDKQAAGKDGEFVFQNLPEKDGRIYILTVVYKGIRYSSTPIGLGQPAELRDQQIKIFEPSTDTSKIIAERVHIFFEFPRPDIIRVVQLYVLSNPTSFILTGTAEGSPVLEFMLPTGASNLQFENGYIGQRFVLIPGGFGDTQGVPPGSGYQILFSFELPYKNDLLIPLKVTIPVEMTNILLPTKGVSIKSSQLQDLGEKNIQNTIWHIYSSGYQAAGSGLDLLVSGKPKVIDPQSEEMNTNLAVGVISMTVVLFISGSLVLQRFSREKSARKPAIIQPSEQTSQEAILDAIIALDDQFHAGQIPQAAYRELRYELKERLRKGQS